MISKITTFALGIAVLGIIFRFIPAMTLPTGIETSLTWLVQTLVNFDFLIPVKTLINLFIVVLTIEIILLTIRATIFIHGVLTGSRSES